MYEFDPTHFQKIKIGVHIAQSVCIFVSWAIEIAVFKAKDSKIDGRPGWYFGLVSRVLPSFSLAELAPFLVNDVPRSGR